MGDKPREPWATDTADPVRVFRSMFPREPLRPDWRLFCSPDDFRRVYAPRKTAEQIEIEEALGKLSTEVSKSLVFRALRGEVSRPVLMVPR